MQENKVAVVTGASSGLGRALCKELVARHWLVAGFARSADKLAELEMELGKDSFRGCAVDVSDFTNVKDALSNVTKSLGAIRIVFNNAAVYPKQNITDQSGDEFHQAYNINVGGIVNITQALIGPMVQSGYGRIINLGSWAHLHPIPDSAAYSATKGMVHSLSKALAVDFSERNIPIDVVEWIPGHLNTQMSDFTGMDPAVAAAWGADLADVNLVGKNHAIFEQNWEWQPPKGLKEKLKSKLLFWK